MLRKILYFGVLATSLLMAGNIEIKDAYVRAAPPGVSNSVSYMKIINHDNQPIYLKRVDSTIAKTLGLHQHKKVNGLMVMHDVESIKVPANSFVMLEPGGYHIMIIGLKRDIKDHDRVKEMNLYFSDGEKITLKNIPVKNVMAGMHMHKAKNK